MKIKNVTPIEAFDDTITKEQLEEFGYLNWPNDVLGRLVKSMSKKLFETDMKGWEAVKTMAAVHLLIACAMDANATSLEQNVSGFTNTNHPEYGNTTWKITIKQIKIEQ